MGREGRKNSKAVATLFIASALLVRPDVSLALVERNVDATVSDDCSFEISSSEPLGELYLNYWDHDYRKLDELGIDGIQIQEYTFIVPAIMSAVYAGHAPISAIKPVYFMDFSATAKTREDIVRLVPPASLKKELTTCLNSLPCPCSTSELKTVGLSRISFESSFHEESRRLQCRMAIYYEDGEEIRIQLKKKEEPGTTKVLYSCRIGKDEVESLLKSWDDACRTDLNDFVEANIHALDKNNDDKTFCPIN